MKTHILALVICALAAMLIPAMSRADEQSSSPYSLEAENGDVLQPDGTVHKAPNWLPSPVNVPESGGVYALPQIVKPPPPEPLGISDKQPAAPMQRVPPGAITSEPDQDTPPAPVEKEPQKKQRRFHSASSTDANSPPDPSGNQAPESGKINSPKSPDKDKNPDNGKPVTLDSAPGPACDVLPLTQDVSFSLQATRIEYNMCDKTLLARDAQYTQSNFTISAKEIRMDLHRGLLAASGGAAAYDAYYQHQHMTGDLVVFNLRTQEGTATHHGVTRAFSVSFIGSYFEAPVTGAVSRASLLAPAAAAPSLQGAADVVFTPGAPRDMIEAGSVSMSSSPGSLYFRKVSYTDASGQPRFVPEFQTRSGTLHEKAPALRSLYVLSSPSLDFKYASAAYDYFFQDNPRGKAWFSAQERHTWDGRNSYNEHDFDYALTKNYIRGNSVLQMSARRFDEWTTHEESFSQYFFPGRFIIRASYLNRDWDSEPYNAATNAYTVLGRWSSPRFFAGLDATGAKQRNRNGLLSSGNDYDLTSNSFEATLRMKPRPVLDGAVLAGLYGNYSVTGVEQTYSRGALFQYDDTVKSITANLLGNPLALTPNLELVTRADWQYRSDDYRTQYRSDEFQPFFNQHIAHGEESAAARAGLRWRALRQWVLGCDYLAERTRGTGGGFWSLYAAYAGADNWTLRIGANYRPELVADGVEFPETVMGETADLSWQINPRTHAGASWDVDNKFLGLSLLRLNIQRDYAWGQLLFRVERNPEQRADWQGGSVRYVYHRTPARYYLNLLFH